MLTTQGKLCCPNEGSCYDEKWQDLRLIIVGIKGNGLEEFVENNEGYDDGDYSLERNELFQIEAWQHFETLKQGKEDLMYMA